MTRRVLIGVSSPVGYFYAQEGEKGRPAPILESPLSYFLLYDEVWFLSRQICPYNMEGLDFVHFVDEELMPHGLPGDSLRGIEIREMGEFPWDTWKGVVGATIGLRWNYDNHARGLRFGELRLLPTPGRLENLLVDRYVAATFEMDLAANTVNQVWSREFDQDHLKMHISERLLQARVASLQTIDGPWHPVVSDLRSDALLKSYRRKVAAIQEPKDLSEIDKRLADLSAEFERVTRGIVASHFKTSSLGFSSMMFLLGLIPGAGNAIGGIGLLKELAEKVRARRDVGWVGFLGRAEAIAPRTSGSAPSY